MPKVHNSPDTIQLGIFLGGLMILVCKGPTELH